jgi:hypothetical protein
MAKSVTVAVPKARIKSPPRASAPGGLSVYDGQIFRGRVVEYDGVFWTFSIDDELLGAFSTLARAMQEFPRC